MSPSNEAVALQARPLNTAPALSVRDVAKTFPNGLTALTSVSFEVVPGGFVSLLGPSGCGKSTLLKMMAGLIAPSEGKIELHGRSVAAPPPGLIYVFQQYSKSLLPWKTVLGNLMFGARSPRARQAAGAPVTESDCMAYVELVGLKGHEDRKSVV